MASAVPWTNALADQDFLGGNGGFELGDFNSWTVVGGQAWDVVEFDHPGKSGRFYTTTCNEIWPGDGGCKNGSGERDTGVLYSEVFTAPGGFLEFRISGFNGPSCDNNLSQISLRRASNHEELRKELLPCQNPFKLHRWSLEDLAGTEVYIRVEDADAGAAWAVMAVDGFRLTSEPPDSPAASDNALALADLSIGEITFTSRRDGGEAIYTTGGGEVKRAVPHVDWKLLYPSWSPDGQTLAAVSNRYTSNQEIYLFFFDPEGAAAGLRALTNHPAADYQPAWSPDGQKIAFISDRTGNGDLYLVSAEGGDPVRLTQGAPASHPSWSPDGRRIAFSQKGDILSVDLLSGAVSVLSDALEWEGYPAWSPGGGRIAFSADGELALLDLRQGTRQQITRGYSHVSGPSWSPDQAFIAFSSHREGPPPHVYMVEVATGRIGRITRNGQGGFQPVWYPGATGASSPPTVKLPPPPGHILGGNGGFELGDFSSWTVVGGQAWDVVEFDHPGKSGRFYATTCNEIWPGDGGCKNGSGERDTGVLYSEVFTAPGGFLEFRISGFNGPSCDNNLSQISLRRASNHEELRKELLPCQNPFKLHRWSLEDLAGTEVYIRVEDADAGTAWAVMAVDGFRLTSEPPDSPAASDNALALADLSIGEITFTSRRDGGEALYTTDGGEVKRAVPHVDWKLWYPSWSPDGQTLAAVSNRYTSNQEIYLFFFDPEGAAAGLRALTNHPAADYQPAWSPDGQKIAFISDRTGNGDLYLVSAEGGDPVRLTQGAPASHPSWSPDGRRIAFSQKGDILSVDLLSGAVSVLSDALEWEGYPAWSPGGGRIAFSADGELALLDLRQGTRQQITRGYSHVSDSSWSPDQAFIAFSSNREGASHVYMVEVATGRIGRITRNGQGGFQPVWYPGPGYPGYREIRTSVASSESMPVQPTTTSLEPTYPNPFNASTLIPYRLATAGQVRLEIHNILGRSIYTLADQFQAAGRYEVHWNGRDQGGAAVAAGVYFARLQFPGGVKTRRLLLLK